MSGMKGMGMWLGRLLRNLMMRMMVGKVDM